MDSHKPTTSLLLRLLRPLLAFLGLAPRAELEASQALLRAAQARIAELEARVAVLERRATGGEAQSSAAPPPRTEPSAMPQLAEENGRAAELVDYDPDEYVDD